MTYQNLTSGTKKAIFLAVLSLGLISCGGGSSSSSEDTTAPNFTSSGSSTAEENQTSVITVQATDESSITYSIAGGDDSASFSIDGSTGVLTFNTAPDFENPTDSNLDNVYVVIVKATDEAGNEDQQTITVTVTKVIDEEDPTFTSSDAATVEENQTSVITVQATDESSITYSIAGGDDSTSFSIDGSTGVLTFNTPPDFENPTDSNLDNVYVVIVKATDEAGNEDQQTITVTVTNVVNEIPVTAATLNLLSSGIKTLEFDWVDVSDATYYRLLENPDGSSGFTQVGDDVAQGTQAYSHDIALYLRVNAQYILQSCNDVGCVDSAAVTVTTSALNNAIGYFKASNTDVVDYFGISLSLSADGNTLAVGAPSEGSNATGINGDQTDNSANAAGAVYVFTKNTGIWSQQAYIKASNTDASDYFGISVSLSADGNTLAVGADGEDSNATGINGDQTDNSAPASGAVYVFTRSAGTWSQQAYIKASNTEPDLSFPTASDYFGKSVSLSADGNTLAVGAPEEDSNATGINGDQTDNSAEWSGAVYVFTRSAGTWSQQAYIKGSNTEARDFFGSTLSLSADGNTLAVGAWGEDSNATGINGDQTDNSAEYAGAIYVFTRSAGIWSQQAYIKASNPDADDYFGYSLSLSADGSTLAVGAYSEGSNATGINGDQTDNSVLYSGAAYIFTRNADIWSQQAYIKASNTNWLDQFGYSLSLSADGNTLAVGACGEDSSATGINGDQTDNSASGAGAGAAYVFTRSAGIWSQQAYIKASNTDVNGHIFGDFFGYSLSLNADGNTLAVGDYFEDSNATGIGGDQSDNSAVNAGAVYLY